MNPQLKAYLKEHGVQAGQAHYRSPEPGDSTYALELACIEIARKETKAANGTLHPTFAPAPSILERLLGRRREHHSFYPVPKVKTILWLWQKYRPTPWVSANNQKVLEGWLEVLYGETDIDVSQLLERVNTGHSEVYNRAKATNSHVSQQERWQSVARLISDALPPYA